MGLFTFLSLTLLVLLAASLNISPLGTGGVVMTRISRERDPYFVHRTIVVITTATPTPVPSFWNHPPMVLPPYIPSPTPVPVYLGKLQSGRTEAFDETYTGH